MTSKIVSSAYAVLSNKPLNKEFSGVSYEIQFKLPSWFTNWGEDKIIKVYGCSFAYLESKNEEPVLSSKYSNQFISVHSNIAKDDTMLMNSVYTMENGLPGKSSESDELKVIDGYMMIENNYYTPKIYNLTDSNLKYIAISFKDFHGEIIPIRSSYSREGFLNEIYQAVFKIELELATLFHQKSC
jgi:hypothetical protein